jgi:superfamily II DNA or RNA helicase
MTARRLRTTADTSEDRGLTSQDLFSEVRTLRIPDVDVVAGKVRGNPVRRIGALAETSAGTISFVSCKRKSGYVFTRAHSEPDVLLINRKSDADLVNGPVLFVPDGTTPESIERALVDGTASWLRPKPQDPSQLSLDAANEQCLEIARAWPTQFMLKPPSLAEGLRPPQVGALHATLAHWSVADTPATIVMPTGTGKTETMLAIATCCGVERLLVIVPNNILRSQVARKFETMGILKAVGCLSRDAPLPTVATLLHRPRTRAEVDDVFLRANVVVTTMAIAGQCAPEVQARMAELSTHLFIDEAHHIGARTWREFRAGFEGSTRILQFTATPFRTDGKRVDGKFIYVYPLAKAQREGYFKPIRFDAVQGFDQAEIDDEIVRRVIGVLAADLTAGFDHLVMARVDNIKRARDVHRRYVAAAPEYNPVIVHSDMSVSEKRQALAALLDRQSRIIVCVDMLGEGFDLPELKIAGLHDRHKSIAVTLQFTGRFTRSKPSLGDATVIANIAQDDIEDALRSLYAEDADWNFLLSLLSQKQTGRQVRRQEILQNFVGQLADVPLQVLSPRMSCVAFRVSCDTWDPHNVGDAFRAGQLHAGPVVNEAERLAVFITRDDEYVRWGDVKQVVNTEWNLYLVHWDEERQMLFINSSKPKDLHDHVAKAIAGPSATRVAGETLFRSLDGFKRLVLTNLGLTHPLGRYLRYTQFMGPDITEQLSGAATQGKRKTNLFGLGFSGGEKSTIGCSAKGRIWAHQVAHDFGDWIEWAREIGGKLLDDSITTDRIIKNLVKSRTISDRPTEPPIAIHWPEQFLEQFEERIEVDFGNGRIAAFSDCEIELVDHALAGPLRFRVATAGASGEFEVCIAATSASYLQFQGTPIRVRIGSKSKTLSEWFAEDPPHIHFASGNFLVFNELFELPKDADRQPFSVDKISTWDWSGVDLSKESQGPERAVSSIQKRVVNVLMADPEQYDIVFDDDDRGEAADIVAMKVVGNELRVDLFHCKFSSAETAGARVDDLYVVCGQAQKCVRWREHPYRLFKHLLKRDADRLRKDLPSRFDKGTRAHLNRLASRWRELSFRYRVTIVQPGLSKGRITPQVLDILSATESYLADTYAMPLDVIASP